MSDASEKSHEKRRRPVQSRARRVGRIRADTSLTAAQRRTYTKARAKAKALRLQRKKYAITTADLEGVVDPGEVDLIRDAMSELSAGGGRLNPRRE